MLWVGEQGTHYEAVPLRSLDGTWEGKKVEVRGKVEWTRQMENGLRFGLKDGKRFSAVKFRLTDEERMGLRAGKWVKAQGRVEAYHGILELKVDRVEALD